MAGIVKKCPCLRPKIEEEVRVLDYRHSSLHDVPSEVFNVERTLEELYADSNQIRDLPRELFYCHGLRKLSISDNEITSIPPAISSLANLEELDFSKNGIIDVPENIKGCKYLRSVDASVNPLGKLPEGFTQLSNLTHLFLNDTFLDYLPGSFGRMVKLRILEMRENHLKTLPRSFSRLVSLERLDIGNNEFTELSDVIGGLVNLLELWCDHNQITNITHSIGQLKQLMFLDASQNQLQELPGEIEGCVCLADLHLTSNNLLSLPDSVGNLNNLTTLKADDNQLTSLPKTLGGLAALSELNVNTNDLQDLPASIGLLRNLRTFYADENLLEFVPAELGSCSGITVLSLRSNRLTYIPDELGRIPRLRVLNLSDNLLRHLPFSIVKLKELQALWLTENQTRPLIPLQSEYEADTGRKILTCYLLPQGEMKANDERDPAGDNESFHASMWDEERLRRQQIHFDFADDSDEEGTLVRCPTPYPKEMREKVRHARNLAMRQMVGVSDGQAEDSMGDNPDRGERNSRRDEKDGQSGSGYSRVPNHPDVRMREARITKPTSPTFQESHRLYRYDKEKILKDKARMQHRLSIPDLESDVSALLKEERGKEKKRKSPEGAISRRSGSVPDLNRGLADDETADDPEIAPTSVPAFIPFEDLYYNQIVSRRRGHRSRRMRDYDSDTGYRSDREIVHFKREAGDDSSKGANSDVMSVRSQPLPHSYRNHRHRRKDGSGVGYASDLESYSAGVFGTANEAAAAFLQKRQQGPPPSQSQQQQQCQLSQNSAQSMPFNLNRTSPSPYNTPRASRNFRPDSPSKSEPHHPNYSSRPNSDYQLNYMRGHNVNSTFDANSTVSNDEFYKSPHGNESLLKVQFRSSDSNERLSAEEKDVQSLASVQTNNGWRPQQGSQHPNSHAQNQIAPGSPFHQRALNLDPSSQNRQGQNLKPTVAPKPTLQSMGGSNQSLSAPPQTPSPSTPVFQKDSFLDQSTPVTSQAPVSLNSAAVNPNLTPGRERRASGLYTVLEERGGPHKLLPSHMSARTSMPSPSPPPYQPAPPYRKSMDPGGSVTPRSEPLSSNSSSSRVDSPHTTLPASVTQQMAAMAIAEPQQQCLHTPPPPVGSVPNINRSQSSPCGFHGSNPYSDLPATPREKLSYSDYADFDRRSRGPHHSNESVHLAAGGSLAGYHDNQTSRSGSSSSQIGSASQIGIGYHSRGGATGGGGGIMVRDRSNSSESRTSDFHAHSSSQDSPRPESVYGSTRRNSQHGGRVTFDPATGAHVSFESPNYEDLTMITNQEQSSQVSSSTDSGYGHGQHVYERIGDLVNARGEGFASRGGPGSHSSGATSTPPSQRQTPVRHHTTGNPPSRESTPIKDHVIPDSTTSQDHRDEFRVTIKKNPGLGFSIAGGSGSHGNPYRPNDKGIFVTKVIPNGPAAQTLRPGDKLLEANKMDFRNIEHNQAVAILKNNSSVSLLVERIQKVNMV
ncbi:uncharacterized protein LOC101857072 [Aplysia californica]|uniref:Uncharacterized protein LOC101857072 n=1 Tax=Aplysia californica TaxID=6500 RepID=A0ABM0K8B4_APLCA|nr:uncharacterized protein LOC101857072 [Aplysia californica]